MTVPDLTAVAADKAAQEHAEKLRLLAEVKKNLPITLEFILIDATITRSKFRALVESGFTEAQAIELCRKS